MISRRPCGFPRWCVRAGGLRFIEAALDLFQDLLEIVRLGLEVARMVPLEARLVEAAHLPVGVTQMVVEGPGLKA